MIRSMSNQRAPRVSCPCGARYSLRVVVEYLLFGEARIDYAGGRLCYVTDAAIDLQIPAGATPLRVLIYDLHEPDEFVRITVTEAEPRRRMSPDAGRDAPGKAGDDKQGSYLALMGRRAL